MDLTEERADAIFAEMDTYTLELANDPGSLGPNYFQDIIATCRNYLNKVGFVLSELNRDKMKVGGELRRLEAVYALEYDNLLANDDRVRALSNIEDRKSTAGFFLRDQRLRINELKDQMHMLDAVLKAVTYRNRELHSTMTSIKDQRRLMQTEISTGAFYGDERVPRSQRSPRDPGGGLGLDDDFNADDLASMLDDELPEPVETTSEQPGSEESDVGDEKGADEKETPKSSGTERERAKLTEADVRRFLESTDEFEGVPPQGVVGESNAAILEDLDLSILDDI